MENTPQATQPTIADIKKAIEQLKQDANTEALAQLAVQAFTDLKETKDLIIKICETFGIAENGKLKKGTKTSDITNAVFKVLTTGLLNSKKVEEKFAFVKEFAPIVERYQNL